MIKYIYGSINYNILKVAIIFGCLLLSFGYGPALYANGPVNNLDYYQISSAEPGPVIVITGGIHGNEIAGFKAAKLLRDCKVDRGTVYIFDRVNAYGIDNNQREFIDGSDLNRKFPGGDSDQASRLAQSLFSFIEENQADLVIDLHESQKCARLDKEYLGQTIITESELIIEVLNVIDKINQQIDQKDYHFMLEGNPVEGSLTWAVNKYLEIPAFTFETCMELELETRIDYQVTLVKYLLQEVGVILYDQR